MLEKLEQILEERIKMYRDKIMETDPSKNWPSRTYWVAKQEECEEILEIIKELRYVRQ